MRKNAIVYVSCMLLFSLLASIFLEAGTVKAATANMLRMAPKYISKAIQRLRIPIRLKETLAGPIMH
ncbi:hypothetical protein [Paenibacillus sp. N3.4]|uniref:hypothetical protein n=1 Tax=Paenibacillus sp. N3.4 TaxID=2603222 RepID=UPI0011C7EAEE|nr:hypothetical protein [Paenibacillus sp. N3.4]TXK84187.1 hypothetical protein FU659_10055 [Paenibacillus sp. N3.4]